MSSPHLWVEKYRPKCLDDVVHHSDIIQLLKGAQKTGQLPHMIFYGPAGTGKTSTVLALARECFGPNLWSDRVLELNASDDRGIDMVREKIKTWSKVTLANRNRTLLSRPLDPKSVDMTDESVTENIPAWKIVLLDEADMMTTDAQSALRRVMEDTSKHTRFVLVCNYLSKIIDPITSRCVKCRFHPIPLESQHDKLLEIATKENLEILPHAMDELVRISDGDLRIAINLMQSAVATGERTITAEAVISAAGQPPLAVAEKLLNLTRDRSQPSEVVQDYVYEICNQGWNVDSVVQHLCELLVRHPQIKDELKATVTNTIATAQKRLVEGASELIQLLMIALEMTNVLRIG